MISPLEIQRNSILCHDGKVKVVKAIGDYILFTDAKAWIGGSMIEGEPISEVWMEKFGFEYYGEGNWGNGKISVHILINAFFMIAGIEVPYKYVHQLQLCHFALTGQHLPLPKLPKNDR